MTRRDGVESGHDDENEAQLLVREDGVQEDEGDDRIEQRRQHGVQVEHGAHHPYDMTEMPLLFGLLVNLVRHLPEIFYPSAHELVRTESLPRSREEGGEHWVQREGDEDERVVEQAGNHGGEVPVVGLRLWVKRTRRGKRPSWNSC